MPRLGGRGPDPTPRREAWGAQRGGATSPPTGAGGAPSPAEATMNAIRSAFLTQTAQAHGATPLVAATPTFVSLATLPVTQAATSAATSAATVVGPSPTVRPLSTATFPPIVTAPYGVKAGDSIYSIACTYGDVDPNAIILANSLTSPYTLTPGATIRVP